MFGDYGGWLETLHFQQMRLIRVCLHPDQALGGILEQTYVRMTPFIKLADTSGGSLTLTWPNPSLIGHHFSFPPVLYVQYVCVISISFPIIIH